jgi:hypothetical protein
MSARGRQKRRRFAAVILSRDSLSKVQSIGWKNSKDESARSRPEKIRIVIYETPKLIVRTRRGDKGYLIDVCDNGSGIQPQHMNRGLRAVLYDQARGQWNGAGSVDQLQSHPPAGRADRREQHTRGGDHIYRPFAGFSKPGKIGAWIRCFPDDSRMITGIGIIQIHLQGAGVELRGPIVRLAHGMQYFDRGIGL